MTALAAFRKQVLAVAAKSRRSLQLSKPVGESRFQLPAFGSPSPVLVIGEWSQNIRENDTEWKSIELIVTANDPMQLDASVACFRETPLQHLRVLQAEPENLKLDLGRLAREWNANPPRSYAVARQFTTRAAEAAEKSPAIPDEYCAVVYCRLPGDNRLESHRIGVVHEVYRVLRRGGAATFSIDLADETSTVGVCTEGAFSQLLADSGFYGIRILDRSQFPVSVGDGIEVYSYVFETFKGKEGPCLDCRQAVIYRGPWKKVFDDDGHVFERDVRTAVCEKTFKIMTSPPYSAEFFAVEPHLVTPVTEAPPFSCSSVARSPEVTKTSSRNMEPSKSAPCC